MTKAISEMRKVASALKSLRKVVEESARDAKRREERRVEAVRLSDGREDCRWEQKKFERQELRRLLLKMKMEETDKDKENKRRSELGRTYTRHSIKDHYSRR